MLAALTLANRLADKREALAEASGRLDALRIALRLAKRLGFLPNRGYERLTGTADEAGRMLGGGLKHERAQRAPAGIPAGESPGPAKPAQAERAAVRAASSHRSGAPSVTRWRARSSSATSPPSSPIPPRSCWCRRAPSARPSSRTRNSWAESSACRFATSRRTQSPRRSSRAGSRRRPPSRAGASRASPLARPPAAQRWREGTLAKRLLVAGLAQPQPIRSRGEP